MANFYLFSIKMVANRMVWTIWLATMCYETILSGRVTFTRHRCKCGHALIWHKKQEKHQLRLLSELNCTVFRPIFFLMTAILKTNHLNTEHGNARFWNVYNFEVLTVKRVTDGRVGRTGTSQFTFLVDGWSMSLNPGLGLTLIDSAIECIRSLPKKWTYDQKIVYTAIDNADWW